MPNLTLLKEQAKTADGASRLSTKLNTMKALFLARVLGLYTQLNTTMPLLVEPARDSHKKVLDALREFEKEMTPYKDPTMKWLDKALDRSHALGIAQLIETFSLLTTEDDEALYAQLGDVFHNIIALRKKGKKINLKKYQLLLQLMEQELQADMQNKKSTITVHNDSLIFDFSINLNQKTHE